MSVLIKHMAMPKGCIYANDKDQTEYCPLLNHDEVPFCQYIENEPEIAIGIDERPVYCPLSDVPEPCQDTVSRQAAIEALDGNVIVTSRESAQAVMDYIRECADRIRSLPSAQPDLDSAYTEGYTAAESKYRKMWDEMQANIKEKAFGKRGGLIHTADIDAMPTIEERKTGKWVGIKEYCDHLNEEAEREGKGNRYIPSGMNIHVYCNQCWKPNDRRTTYCPNCGARMVQEGEENDRA